MTEFDKGLDLGCSMRDELLSLLVAEHPEWPAHLLHRAPDDAADWPFLVCIHTCAGKLLYHISEDRLWHFGSLEFKDCKWDGTDGKVRSERISQLVRRMTA